MFTRAELQYKIKVCHAQMSLRVVVFSLGLIIPAWLGAAILQKMGFTRALDAALRPVGAVLLIAYIAGVFRIIQRTQRDHELVCPKCGRLIGLQAERILNTSACPTCREKIVG